MTAISALVVVPETRQAPTLGADLAAAGFQVVGESSWRNLVRDALQWRPTVVVAWCAAGDEAAFEATALLEATEPCAVLLFTPDARAERMARALDSGVHAYVVNGYGPERLRPLVQMALARYTRDASRRLAFEDLSRRFEERKLVDRAKGILMRAQQISEDEAFGWLRTASQQANQRVGELSQQLIAAAHDAQAINRAGQLRMLSQRVLKLQALRVAGHGAEPLSTWMRQSIERVDTNLAVLRKGISVATYGDLLEAVETAWKPLRQGLAGAPTATGIAGLDARAEALLDRADGLARALQQAGLAPALHVVNLAGRLRMLSQRLAKQAVFMALPEVAQAVGIDAPGVAATLEAFEQGLAELQRLPLSSPELSRSLGQVRQEWQALLAGAQTATSAPGRERLAAASESLLQHLEQVTSLVEHNMQLLTG